jgi:hypothetical protein
LLTGHSVDRLQDFQFHTIFPSRFRVILRQKNPLGVLPEGCVSTMQLCQHTVGCQPCS